MFMISKTPVSSGTKDNKPLDKNGEIMFSIFHRLRVQAIISTFLVMSICGQAVIDQRAMINVTHLDV